MALGGLALLAIGIGLTWWKGEDDFGVLLVTVWWIALCVVVAVVLLLVRAVQRLVARFVKPS